MSSELFTVKNRIAMHRKFFISAESDYLIADYVMDIIITICRRPAAFAEKKVTLV